MRVNTQDLIFNQFHNFIFHPKQPDGLNYYLRDSPEFNKIDPLLKPMLYTLDAGLCDITKSKQNKSTFSMSRDLS